MKLKDTEKKKKKKKKKKKRDTLQFRVYLFLSNNVIKRL